METFGSLSLPPLILPYVPPGVSNGSIDLDGFREPRDGFSLELLALPSFVERLEELIRRSQLGRLVAGPIRRRSESRGGRGGEERGSLACEDEISREEEKKDGSGKKSRDGGSLGGRRRRGDGDGDGGEGRVGRVLFLVDLLHVGLREGACDGWRRKAKKEGRRAQIESVCSEVGLSVMLCLFLLFILGRRSLSEQKDERRKDGRSYS